MVEVRDVEREIISECVGFTFKFNLTIKNSLRKLTKQLKILRKRIKF